MSFKSQTYGTLKDVNYELSLELKVNIFKLLILDVNPQHF